MPPIRIKICGITNEADAEVAVRCGADALGFNFYARSPRHVTEEKAAAIIQTLPASVDPVTLFVNESFEMMTAAAERLGRVRTIQYHGDKIAPCPILPFRFVPAFRISDAASVQGIATFVEKCRDNGHLPAGVLVDAHVAGEYGGTGRTAPWHLLAELQLGVPLILAGGLTPENVAEAIRAVRPYAVDVASGVESSPGRKDAAKVRRFIENAHAVG